MREKSSSGSPTAPDGQRRRFSLLTATTSLYAELHKGSRSQTTAQLLVVGVIALAGIGIIRTPHNKLPVAKAQATGGDPWAGTNIQPTGYLALEDPTVGQGAAFSSPTQVSATASLNFPDPNFLTNQANSDQANQNIGPSADGTTSYIDAAATANTSNKSGSPSTNASAGGGSNPAVEYSFTGLDRNQVYSDPPDTHGAIGRSYYVEIVNAHVTVYPRVTSPGSFFADTLGKPIVDTELRKLFSDSTTDLYDPKVIYDRSTDQFILETPAFPTSSTVQYMYVAVSSSTPGAVPFFPGTYMKHRINVNTHSNSLFDYPSIGIDQNALIFTSNVFTGYSASNNTATGTAGAVLFSIPKSRLYGTSAPYDCPTPVYFTGLLSTLQPPIKLDSTPYTYVISAGNPGFDYPGRNTLQMYRLSNTNLARPTLQAIEVAVPNYFAPRTAKQPMALDPILGGRQSHFLQTLEGRFQSQPTQVSDSLFAVRCGNSTSSRNTPAYPSCEFYEINLGSAPYYRPIIRQHILFRSSTTSDDFNPSLAADDSKNVYINWSATNTPQGKNAQIWCTGRLATDPINTLRLPAQQYQSPFPYLAYTDPRLPLNVSRWGDWSSVTIDPLVLGRAWAVQEMVPPTNYGQPGYNLTYRNSYDWGSQIYRFDLNGNGFNQAF